MNHTIKLTAFAVLITLFVSCSNDDNPQTDGTGDIHIEFDNVYGSNNLELGSQYLTSQGETLTPSDIKYVISNIELTDETGTTFIYPKSQGYFIVSEADENTHVLELHNIPAANYVKIRFGIGVDQPRYNEGQAAQSAFFTTAQSLGMASVWDAGYKHLLFEGSFTSASVAAPAAFSVQTSMSESDYNYTTVTLSFPDKALVRTTITPEVHIFADVAKVIDGPNKFSLSATANGTGNAVIANGPDLGLITANLSEMFTVNHVHND